MGTVYLVGAGPGDPGLITIKGMECLKTCDVVIYDRLVSYQLLEYVNEDCIKIFVGKEAGCHSKKQEEINQIIVQNAKQYESVVRLKGGDPFVFGRGGEEIEELLNNNIPFEVVPGVTSAISVPASVGIPVTHRGVSQSFHVITGHTKSKDDNTLTDNYEILAKMGGTLIFLMGLSNLEQIADNLIQNGKDGNTPVAVISNGTRNNEKTVRGTLHDIVSKVKWEGVVSPAIIVVGDTAALQLVQTKRKPLSDLKIGIIGTKEMREKLEKGLQPLGAEVYTVCAMHLEETSYVHQLQEEMKNIEKYQWIIFTSQNAIHIFFDKMQTFQIDRRILNKIKFAVIGSGTKQALQKYGYIADFIPDKYTTKELAREFALKVSCEDKILIPRALGGSEELTEILKENKFEYKDISVYDIKGKLTENREYLPDMDCLIFVSASGVNAFFEEMKALTIELSENIKIACIGEVTVEAVKKFNKKVDIVASVSNIDSLMEEIKIYFSNYRDEFKIGENICIE
ncbi:MAG: uroporphyrin-III C-methyltransferase [Herbinix sp.]|nr:uroporphyrin-III C-methyltransferase [Herbinix sp.]